MELLEYQAMQSLRDVAHDGVLCTFNNRSASDRDKWCSPSGGRRHGPSITYKITHRWVILLHTARRTTVLGQLSSLRPHCALQSHLYQRDAYRPSLKKTYDILSIVYPSWNNFQNTNIVVLYSICSPYRVQIKSRINSFHRQCCGSTSF
jgi:hypothetical protein